MYQRVLRDRKFLAFLSEVDADLAHVVRAEGCPNCGGVLDGASYPRKPRAVGELGAEYARRISFCCRGEGCRRRQTPPSVRFLGRKVYIAAVVVLATAMQHGATARRVAELQGLLGIGRRTLARWRRWWSEIFTASPSWHARRGLIASPAIETTTFPLSLLERFDGDEDARLLSLLRFVAPVIAESGF